MSGIKQHALRRRHLTAAVVALFVASVAAGQTAQVGMITGVVIDESGKFLQGVLLVARHEDKGLRRSAGSDGSGRFVIAAVPIGSYTITAMLTGYATAALSHNNVEMDQSTDVRIRMNTGVTGETITVSGEVPSIDRTNVAVESLARSALFQTLPVGRTYSSLMFLAPGVTTRNGINARVHGALASTNQVLFDDVDVTDLSLGVLTPNLDYEAIQEVATFTAGFSAEYGRVAGAVVSVITKSGGNDFAGSAKWIVTNDAWNEQNTTMNEITSASLARTKLDRLNPVQSYTLGGPLWRDHAWFFGAYERGRVSSLGQTVVSGETFQQTVGSPQLDARLTAQLGAASHLWIKKYASARNGLVQNYWPNGAGDLGALTRQDASGRAAAGQWTGVFGPSLSIEAIAARSQQTLSSDTFSESPLNNGAPHHSISDGHWYNGATYLGSVSRPRSQFVAAANYHERVGQSLHDFRAGFDWQRFRSSVVVGYPNNQKFEDQSFEWRSRTFVPLSRQDYDAPIRTTSQGETRAIYVRDRLTVGPRWFLEAGLRYENQGGRNDVGEVTVSTHTWSPRLSGSYDLIGNAKAIVVATAARFYQFIPQDLTDQFNQFPPQTATSGSYTNYNWDAASRQYVRSDRIAIGGSDFRRNTDLEPAHMDEITVGFHQRFGDTMAFGVLGIARKWGDLIDDIKGFNADGTTYHKVMNYRPARRNYRAAEITFERRFTSRWFLNANYTYSRSLTNQLGPLLATFTDLGDFEDAECRSDLDPSIGNGGLISCREVLEGRNAYGRSDSPALDDRPHDLKALGACVVNAGRAVLTGGLAGEYVSGIPYTASRSMSVLTPSTNAPSGIDVTYFYEPRGSRRLSADAFLDASIAAMWRLGGTAEVGFKAESFNLTNRQAKIGVLNTAWCANTANPSPKCADARNAFGKATARNQFQNPRNYRVTTLLRF
jgi:carboxypeptidase family protein